MKALLVLAVAVPVALSGCNRFEDGPRFSIYSVEHRLYYAWRLTEAIYDNGPNGPVTSTASET